MYRQIPYFKSSCLALKKKSWHGPLSSPPRDVGYLPKLTILTSWGKWNLALNEQTVPVGCTRRRQRRVSTIEGEIHKRATTATPKMPFLEGCVYLVECKPCRGSDLNLFCSLMDSRHLNSSWHLTGVQLKVVEWLNEWMREKASRNKQRMYRNKTVQAGGKN